MRNNRLKYGQLHRSDNRLDLSPPGRSIFVSREKTLLQQKAKRLRGWMRVVLTAVLVIALGAGAAALITYLGPWFQREISAGVPEPSSQGEEEELSAAQELVYDDLGLAVYGDEVNLFVINRWQPAGADSVPSLAQAGDVRVDRRIAPALRMLAEAAKADGYSLSFSEGYVSYEEQEARFNAVVDELAKTRGLSAVMARTEAAALEPQAGESDFQTGLCVRLDGSAETFDSSRTYSWLKQNMGRYGFTFRYPRYKEEYTGMEYDPTVIRYVGSATASAMRQRGLCLEEYITYLESQ